MARRSWVWAVSALALASVFACSLDYEVDGPKYCRLAPEDPYCANVGGSAGASGLGGTAGTPQQGSGGAPQMGTGGGGTAGSAGAPPCTDDPAGDASCASSEGGGSVCILSACTKASSDCNANALVVVAHGRVPDDASLSGACHYRDLDGARAALGPTTERLALYIDSAASTGVLAFAAAASLEGHASDPAQSVALTLPAAAGEALVTFAQGGTLRGVALNGGGSVAAVRVTGGALTVQGPTTLSNASPALALVGSATATVTGTAAAPVRLSGNRRAVVVPAAATLTMQGDDNLESLVVEGTAGGGAGVLFEAAGTSPCSSLSKVTFRDNTGSSGDGTGAVEVRRGRQVVIDGCTFVHNRRSVTLSGAGGSGGSDVGAFLGVQLENNVFTDALPLEPNTGSVLCGDALGSSDTQLFVRDGNVFPGTPGTCEGLPDPSTFGCDGGQVLGHSSLNMTIKRVCTAGTTQCGSGG